MNRKLFNALYAINIVAQAIFTLAFPIALGVLGSWLLVTYAGWQGWIYAPLVLVGVLIGFYSMIRFVLTAMAGIERLEKQQDSELKRTDLGNDNEEN